MRIVYFVSDGIFAPVLDSQVLVPLKILGQEAPEIKRAAIILTSVRHALKRATRPREKQIQLLIPDIPVHFKYRLPSGFPMEHYIWATQLQRSIDNFGFTDKKPIIIHCRGVVTAAAAAVLKKHDKRIRILLDIRGAQEDEILIKGLWSYYKRILIKYLENHAMGAANGVNAVSYKLIEHLKSTGKLTNINFTSVVGCSLDHRVFYFDEVLREKRRAEMKIGSKFVICYCGAMSHWQRPDLLAEAFFSVRQSMDDTHFLVLTQEAGPLLLELEHLGVDRKDYTVRQVRHDQVASYLMAADVGLLLRENTLTNRVASPVKFAEYLRCGLPLILTTYVGDYSDFARKYDVCQTVDLPLESDKMVMAVEKLRKRLQVEGNSYRKYCSTIAGEHFSWNKNITELINMYHRLDI